MKKLLLVALSTFAVSAHAWEPTYYAGSSIASWQYKQHDTLVVNTNFTVQSIEGVVGITVSPYTSVEGRFGAGLNTAHKVNIGGQGESAIEMPYFGSLYFKPHLTNETASLYGLLGMSAVTIDSTVSGNASREEETTAVSYGVGVTFAINTHFDFTAEWRRLINAEAYDMRGGSMGFVYKF